MNITRIITSLKRVANNKPARALTILLMFALVVFVVTVTHRPVIRWVNCESTEGFMRMEPNPDPTGVDDDYSQALLEGLWPKWTPDGTHVVFVFQDSGTRSTKIYAVAVEGSSLWTISDGGGEYTLDHSPSISPDGARVAYSTYNHVNDDNRYFEIETAALDGSDRRRLTYKAGYDIRPEWLPNQGRIAFRRNLTLECAHYFADFGIYTMKSEGSDVRRILPEDLGGGKNLGAFAWSPDGRQVAFLVLDLGRSAMDVMDVNGSNRKRILDVRETPYERLYGRPVWSHDGERITLIALQGDRLILITIDRNGTGLREFVDLPVGGRVLWSPDGSQIMLASGEDSLYLVKADGSDVRKLEYGHNRYGRLYHAWSPDGSTIAVATTASSILAKSSVLLFTMAPDGSGVRILARRAANGMVESVDPDGWLAVDATSCSAGVVVPEPAANPGLVRDCEVLVEAIGRTGIIGLNWSPDSPIAEWEGVTVDTTAEADSHTDEATSPRRVRELFFGKPFPVAGNSILYWMADLTGLRLLDLSGANLSGPIPLDLGELTQLVELDLSDNALGGPIPSELGNLTALKQLRLSSNGLSGPVPPELGELTELVELDLSRNILDGPIPSELGNLSGLKQLNLSFNSLSGSIPPEFSNLSTLETLNLVSNANLGGCIPLILKEQNIGHQPLEYCDW